MNKKQLKRKYKNVYFKVVSEPSTICNICNSTGEFINSIGQQVPCLCVVTFGSDKIRGNLANSLKREKNKRKLFTFPK